MEIKKNKPWRSSRYLAFVRDQPCMMGMQGKVEAHHLRGLGLLGGMAVKSPDWAAIPLSESAHRKMQTDPTLWADQWSMVARTLGRAIDQGILKI